MFVHYLLNLNLMCTNGQFKTEVVSKYGGFPIDEHTRALRMNIAVASDALLSVNVKFNCQTKVNFNCYSSKH